MHSESCRAADPGRVSASRSGTTSRWQAEAKLKAAEARAEKAERELNKLKATFEAKLAKATAKSVAKIRKVCPWGRSRRARDGAS